MSQDFVVVRHPDAAAFLRRAGAWLLRAEAEHNLVLGVADRLAMGDRIGYQDPIYLATVERDGAVVGCAFRTPPFPVGVTGMPAEAAPALADSLAGAYDEIAGVVGPDDAASALAEAWADRAGSPLGVRLKMRQTIYSLRTLFAPDPWPPGDLRQASGPEDTELAVRWMRAFQEEVAVPPADARERTEGLIVAGDLYFWENGEPRTMAAVVARTPHGARIGYVYTPPPARGKGYGSAVSAAVTARVLKEGARFCFLYADRANPTSNAIYRRLGYRPVCDVADYRIEEAGTG